MDLCHSYALAIVFVLGVFSAISFAAPGVVLELGFNEGSGAVAVDNSGLGNNAALANTNWTTGKYGNGLYFNGVSSYATVNDAISLNITGAITVEAWIYPTSGTGYRMVLIKEINGSYLLYSSTPSNVSVFCTNFASFVCSSSGALLPLNAWSHLAGTYDGSQVRYYLNGVPVSNVSYTGLISTTAGPVRIGTVAPGAYWFAGLIDEIRMYNRSLSQAEIQTDMNTAIGADTTPPSQVTGLTATAVSSSQINLGWNAATDNVGIAGYSIYRCTGLACTPTINIVNTTSLSYSNTGLTANTTYRYTVAAYDAAGNVGAQSVVAGATTQPAPDVTPPNVSITAPLNGATVSGNVTVTANALDNTAVARVEFYKNGVLAANDTAAAYTYIWDTVPDVNGYYNLRARAVDTSGNTANHNITVLVNNTAPDTTPPSQVTGLSATPVSPSQINLVWNAATDNVGVTGYRIYRNDVQVATSATTSYGSTGLAANTTYRHTVAAYDAAGNTGPQSVNASATTFSGSDATPPILIGVNANTVKWNSANIAWWTDENANSTVRYGLTPVSLALGASSPSMTTYRSMLLSGLSSSTAYYFSVTSCDASSNCATSPVYNFTTVSSPQCNDGTAPGVCSPNKPFYCSANYTLINSCTSCGCRVNQTCNATGGNCYVPTIPSFSNLNLSGRLMRTNFDVACAGCTLTITILGQTIVTTTNPAGYFNHVQQLAVAWGYYPATITLNDGSNTYQFTRVVKVV